MEEEEETTGSNVAYITRRMLKNLKIELGLIEVEAPKEKTKNTVTVTHRKKKENKKLVRKLVTG